MTNTPTFLKDANNVLRDQGFATSNVWYHGTSSALVDSIKTQGLKRSGDKVLKNAAKQTMATIGNSYTESIEPVFLTQSKELAFYWAQQTVRNRSVRVEGNEHPVVFAVSLPEGLNAKVKPDVGAASLLLLKEGEDFMAYLAGIYQENGFGIPDIDLMKADRLEYLTVLGMAYINSDISANYLKLVSE
ncbi:hypothetical protein [Zhongshania aliphaticivorans]|uniref:Uncharacterized protein n=1 Tax=Zhongshania aliphaticivorans TaxID=1470434 RepID=A0A127M1L8_9GAMM|nr:hypothetical protein [Zhongshania aliphaticivorans]AMO67121.1 hypothetical protein AZF00_01835 [Zhongshania aliphaticivorans]